MEEREAMRAHQITDTGAAAPLTILVCALGGEGGGVLTEWLHDLATRCGHSAQATSIPGVAQRTGATTYYIEIFPVPDSRLGGRRPVFSLNPVPGEIDLLVSSELLETTRQIGLGMAAADRTTIVTSSARALTVAEKMQLADGRVPDALLLDTVRQHARAAEILDLGELALRANTAISAVLFGAIAAIDRLPFPRSAFEETIRHSGKGVEASLRGFALAFDAVASPRSWQAASPPAAPAAADALLPAQLRDKFPVEVHEFLALGHARLVEYQDTAYADLYTQRLERVLAAERAGDRAGEGGHTITREVARWLALWMAYDDIVRVAQIKQTARRAARVRGEVSARDDEIVRVYDHFKPGVAEFAALLPAALADRLTGWDARRRARGLDPWAFPLKLPTHTVRGALALRLLSALKRLRRRGSRYGAEQQLIERWLAAVERGARQSWTLGHEIALCGRLIKGYGSTNERGKENLLHVIDHLAVPQDAPASLAAPLQQAEAIRAARAASLADDAGRAFDRVLQQHGAPARTVRAVPIRWTRKRPAGSGAAADRH